MKTVILGAGGQLAFDLERELSDWDLIPLSHAELDICEFQEVREKLAEIHPEIVINTSAFHRVDDCEDQVGKAFGVNAYAVRNLAQIVEQLDCTLVHYSTDYVFDGSKQTPYSESDPPNPLSVYGVSKLAGELFVRNICPRHFLIRSSGLYGVVGSSGKGGNFVETMIRLAKEGKPIRVVDDQVLSPTYTRDLAEKTKALLNTDGYGLFHITNSGECSWYAFAAKIFDLINLTPDFGPTTSKDFGARAQRPSHSVLENAKLNQLDVKPLQTWGTALRKYLVEKEHIP